MKKNFLILVGLLLTVLITCMLYVSCGQQNMITEESQDLISYSQNADTEESQDVNTEELQDGNTDEPQNEDTDELQGEIVYPKYGKYGLLNILADDFTEATQMSEKRVEYSLYAEVPAGAGLKIVIITKSDNPLMDWGGIVTSDAENWRYTYYDHEAKSNTFTVWESGKPADLPVIFGSDCIIEYYENGATTPTKVKEISVAADIITEAPKEPETEGLQGMIVYPKYGKYGILNILADDFVEATKTENGRFEYSLYAEVPVGAGLKIVVKSKSDNPHMEWGGIVASGVENWRYTYYDREAKSNTFTVWESGKPADLAVIFGYDCIIEYYENGATVPTKVKEIRVAADIVTEAPKEPNTEGLQGVIVYPKHGKYGLLNVLADDFVEAKKTEYGRFEYSLYAEVPVGAGLKIVIKTKSDDPYMDWGGIVTVGIENWRYTYYDRIAKSNTFTVWESGKPADLSVVFGSNCYIEYYENGSKTPTKVKEIKVIQ